ncbi:DUF2255 family protein [Streptomyces sp. PsTaAH-124]|uniref:DUF2255 family protein n=1 Tax=Streptomyces sp. PsTaAH-124 TaxID=1157638 RepID=UPI000382F27C|nr:DUF2255 family protein [Streptomyces sp. PsTaAH-124]
MNTWTPEDLALLAAHDSLVLTAGDSHPDGVETGMVLVRGALYVRAFRGVGSRWFRAAREHGRGRIRVGPATREVLFVPGAAGPAAEIDAAYRDRYGPAAALVHSPAARAATLRIDPAPTHSTAFSSIS